MKKSLIAIAVLAASGTSFAQSSVTLYGIADVYLASVKANGSTTTRLDSGGVNISRWGIKGSEDLGGGLKANFKLEQGFDVSTGAATSSTVNEFPGTGSQAFDRQAYVGLSGGFGEIQLGKSWSAYDDVEGTSDAMWNAGALSTMWNGGKSGNYIDRPINGIKYITPTMSGLTGAVSYSLKEGSTTLPSVAAVSLDYAAGPLGAQVGYQVESTTNLADVKFLRLGASYNLGMVTPKVMYGKVDNLGNLNGAQTTEWQIGADVPVSPTFALSGSYGKSDDNVTAGDATRKSFAFGGKYDLSKRTFLYGGYLNVKTSNTSAVVPDYSVFALGVQHKF